MGAVENQQRPSSGHPDDDGLDVATDALRTAGRLAGDVSRLGAAWLELARAELAIARLSASRLAKAAILMILPVFAVWLLGCLALAYWLAALPMRMDLALVIVAAVNIVALAVLIVLIRRWWRAMQMPGSRAALGEIARVLS